jgi:hypothetical protein
MATASVATWFPRAAASDHRTAALVLDGGIYCYFDATTRQLPPWLLQWILDSQDADAERVLAMAASHNTSLRWALRNSVWTFGADSVAYTLDGVVGRITTLALIFDPDHDAFLEGEPARLHRSVTGPSTLITLSGPKDSASAAPTVAAPPSTSTCTAGSTRPSEAGRGGI